MTVISRLGPKSLSPLQAKYEELDQENGPLGALLASKAFVQLAFTPVMGYLTEVLGGNIPLFLGSCNMLLAALCKYSFNSNKKSGGLRSGCVNVNNLANKSIFLSDIKK